MEKTAICRGCGLLLPAEDATNEIDNENSWWDMIPVDYDVIDGKIMHDDDHEIVATFLCEECEDKSYQHLLGLSLSDIRDEDMIGYYPVVDEDYIIVDVIDGDNYSHIFGRVRDNIGRVREDDCYKLLASDEESCSICGVVITNENASWNAEGTEIDDPKMCVECSVNR